MASPDPNFIGYLSVAMNATVLPMEPAGVETGTSTSRRCSPVEPQAIDCTKVCATDPNVVPSMAMACEDAASMRAMLTFTREGHGVPGQSTFSAKGVEITNDLEVFRLLSPGAEAPLK
jgi:hypothetical protein